MNLLLNREPSYIIFAASHLLLPTKKTPLFYGQNVERSFAIVFGRVINVTNSW